MQQLEDAVRAAGDSVRLHLGCGERRFPGYINVDYPRSEHTVQLTTGADIFADVTKLELPPESVDEIRHHHMFEHFSRFDALALLIRWQEWLKVGGLLHIETPDTLGCARDLANADFKTQQAILRHLFGSHEAEWAYHLDGWYESKFVQVLSGLGFDVQCHDWKWPDWPYLSNVTVLAHKKTRLSREQLLEQADDFLKLSVVNLSAPTELALHAHWCGELRRALG
jgi:hypothetical protein